MTVYQRRKTFKFFLCATIIVMVLFVASSILSIVRKEYYLILIMLFFLLLVGGMFFLISLIEYKSILEIGKDRIVFHYKVFSQDSGLRGFNWKGLTIFWNEIKTVQVNQFIGDHIVTADTRFVSFLLKDGRIFKTTFFHFGKDKEYEILNSIQSYVPEFH